MKVQVKSMTGKIYGLEVEKTDTIKELKSTIEQKVGVPPEQQRLVVSGKVLPDEKTLQELGIKENEIISVVIALRGGF